LSEQESEQLKKQKKLIVPKPQTLNKFNFANNNESSRNPKLVDGFFLVRSLHFLFNLSFRNESLLIVRIILIKQKKMQTFCIEDPLDLTTIDISYKGLNEVSRNELYIDIIYWLGLKFLLI
jgi:hypothetical protein